MPVNPDDGVVYWMHSSVTRHCEAAAGLKVDGNRQHLGGLVGLRLAHRPAAQCSVPLRKTPSPSVSLELAQHGRRRAYSEFSRDTADPSLLTGGRIDLALHMGANGPF